MTKKEAEKDMHEFVNRAYNYARWAKESATEAKRIAPESSAAKEAEEHARKATEHADNADDILHATYGYGAPEVSKAECEKRREDVRNLRDQAEQERNATDEALHRSEAERTDGPTEEAFRELDAEVHKALPTLRFSMQYRTFSTRNHETRTEGESEDISDQAGAMAYSVTKMTIQVDGNATATYARVSLAYHHWDGGENGATVAVIAKDENGKWHCRSKENPRRD